MQENSIRVNYIGEDGEQKSVLLSPNLLVELEKLIEKWESEPYTRDSVGAALSHCADDLRRVLSAQQGVQWTAEQSAAEIRRAEIEKELLKMYGE